ncbi:MAG: hypothetical protein J6S21_04365, partial [Victivallales bacterium]|nr:hypothetical protein [Victivallales bacterium]
MQTNIFDTILISDEEFGKIALELSESYPHLVRLGDIGISQEGRPIRLLTVTEFASGEDKPALFIQGTIHSKELSGTLVGLDIVKRLAEDHVPGGILSRAVFYIMPRCNPDGANRMAVQPGDERSSWGPATGVENGLERCSFTPDGCCKYMLVETPEGKLCFSDRHPLCLVDRTPESRGPFYNFMPEGTLSNFNRETLTDWPECAREYIDWNRNWPVGWCDGQYGCGSAPLSVPEVKMQAEWMAAHPNIRAAVALHNGYGSFLFPSPRPEDREYMEDLGRRGEALVGYPAYYGNSFVDVSCQVPPQGTFSDYCYFGLNILGLTLELGTRENSAGADTRELF